MNSTPTSAHHVVLGFQGRLARIELNHPPVNVLDFQMMDELLEALCAVEKRTDVCAVVLSGSEKAFSAGVDVAIHTPDKVQSMLQKFHCLIGALVRLRKITIAEVRGSCLGGGAELAMLCDLVYTAKDARWGYPEITLGCYPPVACAALSALVGEKRAADLIFTGRIISGDEAASWGLANEACAEGELQQIVQRTLDRLLQLSRAALACAKKAFYAWDSIHLDKGIALAEKIYLEDLMKTEDAREGINAWMRKCKPEWKGR